MTRKPRHKISDKAPGVDITTEVSLKVDWGSLVTGLTTVAAQGAATYFGATDGTSNAISALVSAAGSIRVDTPVGERAWALFCLSFAWAFDELRELGDLGGNDLLVAVREALKEAKKVVENRQEVVPASFLVKPTSLPLYCTIRDEFIRRKAAFRPSEAESDTRLQARFDAAFNRAVYEIWSRNPEAFQPLEMALTAPAALASAFEVQWQAYRKGLIYDFEIKPVFGQEQNKVALSQLYVPLRGTWREEPETDEPGQPRNASSGTRAHIVNLDEELDAWVLTSSQNDDMRLIGGGPGSGKSTTVRALARRMADREDRRPLFIPLQHIDIDRDLRDAVNNFFVERIGSAFRHAPLSRDAVEHSAPLLLIFDGLDELARPGKGALEVAQLFAIKISQLINSLRGDGTSAIKVIVTGRMPSFQAARKYASLADRCCYEVLGFLPRGGGPERAGPGRLEHQLANVDQRPIWWEKYAASTGASKDVPRAMTDPRLRGLTDEPLLCYLLAISGYAVDNWEEAAENRNRIYERLVNEIWKRGWGDGGRQGAGKSLTQTHFNRLMETIALAAWRGGDTRVASETGFVETLDITQANEAWDQFRADGGSDVNNLATNFYLKSSETDRRGFEFTHKSFGDYLAARAFLTVANGVLELGLRRIEAAASEWFKATSPGILTQDIIQFLRDEVRLSLSRRGIEQQIAIKDYFAQLASLAIKEGLPVQSGVRTWRSAELAQRNAELAVWAVISANALAIGASDPSSARIRIEWGPSQAFADLLDRLGNRKSEIVFMDNDGSVRVVPEFNIKVCLAYLEAAGADLSETNLRNSDLRHTNLRRANLVHADLSESSVAGANFDEARFFFADLSYVDFREAHVDKCEFGFAGLSGTNFTPKQLSQIAFTPLSLAVKHNFDLSEARIDQRYGEPSARLGRPGKAAVDEAVDVLEQLLLRLKRERTGKESRSRAIAQDWAWLAAVVGPLDADFAQAATERPAEHERPELDVFE